MSGHFLSMKLLWVERGLVWLFVVLEGYVTILVQR